MGRHSTIPVLFDFCIQLSISDLKRWGYFNTDYINRVGAITFRSFFYGELGATIKVCTAPNKPEILFCYSINGTEFNYHVRFELMRSNLGKGFVWYFVCPRSGKRCRKLYLIDNYFCHRSACSNGMYQTQTLGERDKHLIRQFDKSKRASEAERKLNSKHFRKYYKGKPTKKYLKLMQQVRAGDGIPIESSMMR